MLAHDAAAVSDDADGGVDDNAVQMVIECCTACAQYIRCSSFGERKLPRHDSLAGARA